MLAATSSASASCSPSAGVPQPRWEVVGRRARRARARRASSRRPTATAAAARVLVLDDADLPGAIEEARARSRAAGAVLVEELVDGPGGRGQRVLGRTAS